MTSPTDKQITAADEAMQRFYVQGSEIRDYEAGYGSYSRYTAPWFVIDTSTAEYEVNYPGDLIEECATSGEAYRVRAREIARAVLEAKDE